MTNTIPFKSAPGRAAGSEDSYVRIVLRDMEVDIRIGINADEKGGRKQKVLVNVELYTDRQNYLRGATPKSIIDYSKVIAAVQGWAEREHTLLIESYINELLEVCFAIEGVEACKLSILKTEICKDARGAGVEVFMTGADYGS